MSMSGIILVIAGALLLANNFGLLHWGWMQQWWPVFLIALGLWSILRPARSNHRHERVSPSPVVAPPPEADRRP